MYGPSMPGNSLRGLTFHVVGGNALIQQLFSSEGARQRGLEHSDIIVFQGGTDVGPNLYHAIPHHLTDKPDTRRDRMEQALYHELDKRQFRVGICRGAQFLNVMNGGRLWQHVENHTTAHEVRYVTETDLERAYMVSSTHHQMMMPKFPEAVVWAWAKETNTREFPDGKKIELSPQVWKDYEVIHYPKSNSLCFQPHPEYNTPKQTRELFLRCMLRMIES